ncbi:phage tail assembly protein [Cytobacillus sp. IB215665]|uniref:phage tail assembly protein n=1 Tax=Cytobacillus sp. IB215665 TaxID=3097357 RepID=UPI002A0F4D1A|nr:phage tail assembly protein [Cytobacillus sp. IB215665]MDX8367784.1 phage tail assembly protein [Cytobacillus sp. IB215665]
MKIELIKPFKIDGKELKEIDLNLENLTGADILKIDMEMRREKTRGFADVYDQEILLRLASKACGILKDDLEKLPINDFLEVTFGVRNFLLRSSEEQEELETSEKSS